MDEERRCGERERKVVILMMMMKELQYVDLVLARMYSQFVVLVLCSCYSSRLVRRQKKCSRGTPRFALCQLSKALGYRNKRKLYYILSIAVLRS